MSISHPLLTRRQAQTRPGLPLLPSAPQLELTQARVHEACGTARRTMALWLAAQSQGPVIWVAPHWIQEQLHCDGVASWIDPARLIFIHPRRPEDVLWTMEEILRTGAVSLAVADLPGLPGLTQVRRMHLAAETGAVEGRFPPLGLLLTPEAGGAAGVETRWRLTTAHVKGTEGWRLDRLRARTAPRQSWNIHRPQKDAYPEINPA